MEEPDGILLRISAAGIHPSSVKNSLLTKRIHPMVNQLFKLLYSQFHMRVHVRSHINNLATKLRQNKNHKDYTTTQRFHQILISLAFSGGI